MKPQGKCKVKLDVIVLSVRIVALLSKNNIQTAEAVNSNQTIMVKVFAKELKLGIKDQTDLVLSLESDKR